MLAWSAEDAGKIIETYKRYEIKPPDDIMERSDSAPHQKVNDSNYFNEFVKKFHIYYNFNRNILGK